MILQINELVTLKLLLQTSISVSQSVPKQGKVEKKEHFQILSVKDPFSRKSSISLMAKPWPLYNGLTLSALMLLMQLFKVTPCWLVRGSSVML